MGCGLKRPGRGGDALDVDGRWRTICTSVSGGVGLSFGDGGDVGFGTCFGGRLVGLV